METDGGGRRANLAIVHNARAITRTRFVIAPPRSPGSAGASPTLAPEPTDHAPDADTQGTQETDADESHPDQGFHVTLPSRLFIVQVFPLQLAFQLGRVRRQALTAARGVKHMGIFM